MWNYINTGRVLILTLSKVKLTLMILLCRGALTALINASGVRARGMMCACTGIMCVDVVLPFNQHTRRHACACTNIRQGCASFSVLCVTLLTVAIERCLVCGSSPGVNKVYLHRHLHWPTSIAQHGTAGPGNAAGP